MLPFGLKEAAERQHAVAQSCQNPTELSDTCPSPYLVTKISPRAAYRVGTGSVTTLCSMPPNSSRVR
jgi:hypothetical protein